MTTEFEMSSRPGPVQWTATPRCQMCGACGHAGLSYDDAKRFCRASRDRTPGWCLRLHDPCFPRRNGKRTRRQHGPAIRGAHARPRSTQPNVRPPHCALPGIPSTEHAAGGSSSLSRGLDQGAARGEFGPRVPPRSHTAGSRLCSPTSGRCLASCGWSSTTRQTTILRSQTAVRKLAGEPLARLADTAVLRHQQSLVALPYP